MLNWAGPPLIAPLRDHKQVPKPALQRHCQVLVKCVHLTNAIKNLICQALQQCPQDRFRKTTRTLHHFWSGRSSCLVTGTAVGSMSPRYVDCIRSTWTFGTGHLDWQLSRRLRQSAAPAGHFSTACCGRSRRVRASRSRHGCDPVRDACPMVHSPIPACKSAVGGH